MKLIFLLFAMAHADVVVERIQCKSQCDKILQAKLDQCFKLRGTAYKKYTDCMDEASKANCECQERCMK